MARARLGQHQRDNIRVQGHNSILYLRNDSEIEGACCVYGSGFSEELPSLVRGDIRPIYQDASDPVLIRKDAL